MFSSHSFFRVKNEVIENGMPNGELHVHVHVTTIGVLGPDYEDPFICLV
jgi:hypothetical protein